MPRKKIACSIIYLFCKNRLSLLYSTQQLFSSVLMFKKNEKILPKYIRSNDTKKSTVRVFISTFPKKMPEMAQKWKLNNHRNFLLLFPVFQKIYDAMAQWSQVSLLLLLLLLQLWLLRLLDLHVDRWDLLDIDHEDPVSWQVRRHVLRLGPFRQGVPRNQRKLKLKIPQMNEKFN